MLSDFCGTAPVSVEIASVEESYPINGNWEIIVSVSWDASLGESAVSLSLGKNSFTIIGTASTGANTSFKTNYSFSDNPHVECSWGSSQSRFSVRVDASGVSGRTSYKTTVGNVECTVSVSLRYRSGWACFKYMVKRAFQSWGCAVNPYGTEPLPNGLSYGVCPIMTVGGSIFPWTMQLK